MPNTNLRCGGEPDNLIPVEDRQVDMCFKLANRWKDIDRLIAQAWWEQTEEDRNMSAIARRHRVSGTKVDNTITWIQDLVIRECVKATNIYP